MKFVILFFVGAILGPIGDYAHVSTSTTSYGWQNEIVIARSPIWFVLLVGSFIAGLGFLVQSLRHYLSLTVSSSKAKCLQAISAALALYCMTGLLPSRFPIVEVLVLSFATLYLWVGIDFTALGFICGAVAAFIGTVAEMGLVAIGAHEFLRDELLLVNVPVWLSLIYFMVGVAVTYLESYFDRPQTD